MHPEAQIDTGWYPQTLSDINDIDAVLHGEGVFGFIFNGSTTPDYVPYSTYNWANMPHVRESEYIKPSLDYSLRYVEVVSRARLH